MAKGNGTYQVASRKEILSAFKASLQRETVELPECGISVLVWELTAPERIKYQETLTTSKHRIPIGGRRGVRERSIEIESHQARGLLVLCAMAMKDENGVRQFDEVDLVDMPARSLARIFSVAERLSGLGEEALGDEGESLTPIQSSSPTSRSASPSDTEPSGSTAKA